METSKDVVISHIWVYLGSREYHPWCTIKENPKCISIILLIITVEILHENTYFKVIAKVVTDLAEVTVALNCMSGSNHLLRESKDKHNSLDNGRKVHRVNTPDDTAVG